jgi:hypothetical protein
MKTKSESRAGAMGCANDFILWDGRAGSKNELNNNN